MHKASLVVLFLGLATHAASPLFAQGFSNTPTRPAAVRGATQAELKAKLCSVQSKALSLPITLDEKAKAELVAKMGEKFAADLLRPVAYTNLMHRCICAKTMEERLVVGC